MPFLIFTGHPCAGKSTLAEKFRVRALQHSSQSIHEVIVVTEATACPDHTQQECYESSLAEKTTRGALKSAFERAVALADESTLVILDSLNYIKGFRYELFCISKAAKERHGVVWVLNDPAVVKEWNRQRSLNDETYSPDLLMQLMQRYEPPDERNRWDKPLYRVDVRPPATDANANANDSTANANNSNSTATTVKQENVAQDVLHQSVYNMHALSDAIGGGTAVTAPVSDATTTATTEPAKKFTLKRAVFKRAPAKPVAPTAVVGAAANDTVVDTNGTAAQPTVPNNSTASTSETANPKVQSLQDRIDEILDSFLVKERRLREGASTRQHVASDSDVLHTVDSVTQQVCSAIATAQSKSATTGSSTGSTLLPVTVRGETLSFKCHRRLGLPELRRHRAQYLQWVATHPPEDTSDRGIAGSFLCYIEAQR